MSLCVTVMTVLPSAYTSSCEGKSYVTLSCGRLCGHPAQIPEAFTSSRLTAHVTCRHLQFCLGAFPVSSPGGQAFSISSPSHQEHPAREPLGR